MGAGGIQISPDPCLVGMGQKKREKGSSPSHLLVFYLVMTKEAMKYATSADLALPWADPKRASSARLFEPSVL